MSDGMMDQNLYRKKMRALEILVEKQSTDIPVNLVRN